MTFLLVTSATRPVFTIHFKQPPTTFLTLSGGVIKNLSSPTWGCYIELLGSYLWMLSGTFSTLTGYRTVHIPNNDASIKIRVWLDIRQKLITILIVWSTEMGFQNLILYFMKNQFFMTRVPSGIRKFFCPFFVYGLYRSIE
jgi:hypothetical protein